MPLQRGKIVKVSNEIALFTMLNGADEVQCKVSLSALEKLRPGKRLESNTARFERSWPAVAEVAERKFFSFNDDTRPAVIEIKRADVE
jgi:hypothetical protein